MEREPPKNIVFGAVIKPKLVKYCKRGIEVDHTIFGPAKSMPPVAVAASAPFVTMVRRLVSNKMLRVICRISRMTMLYMSPDRWGVRRTRFSMRVGVVGER